MRNSGARGAVGLVALIIAAFFGYRAYHDSQHVTTSSNGGVATTQVGTGNSDPAANDVRLTSCGLDPKLGWMRAKVAVTNGTTTTATYAVVVAFDSLDRRTQYGSGYANVSNLAPGQTTVQIAQTTIPGKAGQFQCKVSGVTRLAS